ARARRGGHGPRGRGAREGLARSPGANPAAAGTRRSTYEDQARRLRRHVRLVNPIKPAATSKRDAGAGVTNTPIHPRGQMVFVAVPKLPPKGTKTSPDTGSTATEWSPGVVRTFSRKVSVKPSMMPSTGPPGFKRAARKNLSVVGSNHTMSSPLTCGKLLVDPFPPFAFGSSRIDWVPPVPQPTISLPFAPRARPAGEHAANAPSPAL